MTLLTVAEFRAYVTTELSDPALQGMLDAAEAEINMAAGPVGAATELFGGGQRLIVLARPASAITSITETFGNTVDTLATDDYLLYPGGFIIERLSIGTNGRWRWWGRVAVTYTPADDTALRKDVQRELVSLDVERQAASQGVSSSGGATSERIGDWEQRFGGTSTSSSSGSVAGFDAARDAILSRLSFGPSMAVVG